MRQVKRLSAQGVVPSFVGKRIAVVEGERSLAAYNWKLRTTDRSSARAPGTVLSQSPAAGATLKAGRSITVVIAKKAPLRPKRWVAVRRLTGAGATRTRPITIPRRVMARLVYEMPQNGSNAMVLYRADTASGELLFNTVGPRRGIVNLREPGRFYLEVTGRFRIEVQAFTRPR
jgi:hypothetical protein